MSVSACVMSSPRCSLPLVGDSTRHRTAGLRVLGLRQMLAEKRKRRVLLLAGERATVASRTKVDLDVRRDRLRERLNPGVKGIVVSGRDPDRCLREEIGMRHDVIAGEVGCRGVGPPIRRARLCI
jgi:hypothetical protein